jgi:hypothetical protein
MAKKKSGKSLVVRYILDNTINRSTSVLIFCPTFYKDDVWISIAKLLDKKKIVYQVFSSVREDGINVLDELITEFEKPEEEKEEVKKYETQEFYSNINPWNESKKVKYMEICVPKGTVLFIPAYWWYSIRLEKEACVCSLQYTTFMNLVATLPNIAMGILQRHNTKTKVLPTYSPVSTEQDAESHTSEDPVQPL